MLDVLFGARARFSPTLPPLSLFQPPLSHIIFDQKDANMKSFFEEAGKVEAVHLETNHEGTKVAHKHTQILTTIHTNIQPYRHR